MLTEAELLQYIYQTTEMGRDGIQSVLPHAEDETFHQALEQQLTEYEKLYGATGKMLRERGQEPKGLNPMVKASSEMMSAMKTMADHSTSKIAEMMIQGNTHGHDQEPQAPARLPWEGRTGTGSGQQAAENRGGQYPADEEVSLVSSRAAPNWRRPFLRLLSQKPEHIRYNG